MDTARAVDLGALPGPRVVAAGRAIAMTGGHRWFLGREADGTDAVRRAVREEMKAGATCMKLMASGGTYGHAEESGSPQLTVEEMRAGVEEAHKGGRKVAAHAYSVEAISNALDAGVDSIEHSSFLDQPTAERMKDQGTYPVLPHTGKLATPESILRVAEEAERMGCATVRVLERLLRLVDGNMPDSYATVYDPMETLSFVAARTKRVKLGTSIMDVLLHVPVAPARRFATLDHLSGGRVIAGLGQGYAPEEFVTANVPLSRRGAGFEEFIGAMRVTWGPDPVRFSGRFYNIPESEASPKPRQDDGPPITIAATKPPAVERAGRLGFGLNPLAPSWEVLEDAIVTFRNAAGEAGHDERDMPIVARANMAVGEAYAPEDEPPLSGSREKVVADLERIRELGVNGVFFDMNRYAVPIENQIRTLDRLRDEVS